MKFPRTLGLALCGMLAVAFPACGAIVVAEGVVPMSFQGDVSAEAIARSQQKAFATLLIEMAETPEQFRRFWNEQVVAKPDSLPIRGYQVGTVLAGKVAYRATIQWDIDENRLRSQLFYSAASGTRQPLMVLIPASVAAPSQFLTLLQATSPQAYLALQQVDRAHDGTLRMLFDSRMAPELLAQSLNRTLTGAFLSVQGMALILTQNDSQEGVLP